MEDHVTGHSATGREHSAPALVFRWGQSSGVSQERTGTPGPDAMKTVLLNNFSFLTLYSSVSKIDCQMQRNLSSDNSHLSNFFKSQVVMIKFF